MFCKHLVTFGVGLSPLPRSQLISHQLIPDYFFKSCTATGAPRPPRWRIRTCTFDAKGSVLGDPGIIYFSGERSEPVFCGAAGKDFAKFKARMVNFMSKWDTWVVYG